jgi:hypothetical protein
MERLLADGAGRGPACPQFFDNALRDDPVGQGLSAPSAPSGAKQALSRSSKTGTRVTRSLHSSSQSGRSDSRHRQSASTQALSPGPRAHHAGRSRLHRTLWRDADIHAPGSQARGRRAAQQPCCASEMIEIRRQRFTAVVTFTADRPAPN